MRYWKGILIVFLSFLASNASPQEYNFRNFGSEEGLSRPYVYSIIQDAQGYLWVGTDKGLSKYNGFTFDNLATNESLTGSLITCSIRDSLGLWFGNSTGGLSYYDGKNFRAFKLTDPDLSRLTHFSKNPDDHVWVSTYAGGLLKLDQDSGVVKSFILNNSESINSFFFITESDLLIGTNKGLLFCRLKIPGEIEIIRLVSEIPVSKISDIIKIRNRSGFYIATENEGIYQLNLNNSKFEVSEILPSDSSVFTGIQDIYEDSLSDLWICSFGKGLIKLTFPRRSESEKVSFFTSVDGFITDNVKTVFEDREGNIWSGNYGKGLTLITPKLFSLIKFDNPLYGSDVFSLWFNRHSGWIGTENGMVKIDQLTGRIIKFFGNGSGLPKDSVTAIYSGDGKDIWIGTCRNGVYRMNITNENISAYPLGDGLLENSITAITGKEDQIWIGTKKGLCNINPASGKKTWFTINQGGLPHNNINGLYLDKEDRLWVSTSSNILSFIKGGKVFKIPLFSANGFSILGPVTEDTDSTLWVGSIGNGVFLIKPDSIINITIKEGLVSNYCYSLICDDRNNIWVGHKSGLSRIRISDFFVKPLLHFDGTSDSYQFNPNAIVKDRKGRIWFGTDKGILSYDPSGEYPVQQPPVLGITLIKINDDTIDFKDRIVLRPGSYRIRIDFLGISLKEPSLVTYQYKLAGYDEWSDITKIQDITYNHLSAGDYTFILYARSGDGAVTENPLTIGITIKKSIWMRWWFYIVMLLSLFIAAFLYIKRREYKFISQNRILEEKVSERTYEIERQKNEIELQRDLIEKKNESITSSIKYASHIQNAVLPPGELINTLLPENFLLSIPKDIVSGDFFWLAEKDDKVVFTVADCTGHGVPGAFMSLLGITFLNEIVNIEGITRSDAIVSRLREKVIRALQQGRRDIPTSDGMDIALCVLDRHKKIIQYTGGMQDILYIRNETLHLVKSDRASVCVLYKDSIPFTLQEIEIKKGDVFYLYSDGYQDQFGGEYDKKFLTTHFHLTLLEIHKLSMSSQKEILENKFKEWKKETIQTDDITVVGIRI